MFSVQALYFGSDCSLPRLGSTDMVVSSVGIGGCVVGGVYPDAGTMEEILQVKGFICMVEAKWCQM